MNQPNQSGRALPHSKITAKLTDFGIGQVVSEEALRGVTKAGFTQTIIADSSSSQTGSQMYMAPELLAGKPASIRSDIYSLGVVLFQLVVGDFQRPVTTDWAKGVSDRLLREDLQRCFAGNPEERFSGAAQLAKNLRLLAQRRAAFAQQQAAVAELERMQRTAARRRVIALASAGAVAVLLLLALTLGYGLKRARAAELLARKHLYAADMLLAAQAFQANNRGRAVQLLEKHESADGVDLRGWEWRYLWSLCRSEAVSLTPTHSDLVSDVAFSADGSLLYSASIDATIKVWDVAARSMLSSHPHPCPIQAMALSPDGRWLVTGGPNNQVIRWDLRTWASEPLTTNKEGIRDLLFSPDGDRLAVRSWSEVRVLQLSNRTPIVELATLTASGSDKQGQSMAFSPKGELLAFPAGNRIALSDLKPGSGIRFSPGLMDRINSIAFSADGRILAASDWSPRIAVWDLTSDTEVASLTNHTAWISSVAFLPDGARLISAGADQTVKYWSTSNWQAVATRRGHLDEVSCLTISPRGDRMATGSKDGGVNLWSTAIAPRQATRLELGARTRLLSLDGRTLLVMGNDRTVIQYDATTLEAVRTNSTFPHAVSEADVALGLGVRSLALGKPDGDVEIWDTVTWDRLAQWNASTTAVSRLEFSMDGALVAGVSAGNTLSVWDVASRRRIVCIGRLALSANSTAVFSRDNKLLATVVEGYSVQLWSLDPALLLRTLRGQRQNVTVAFSPDGRFLAAASADASLKLWNLATGSVTLLPRALMAYYCVGFSPDGQRIAAAGPDPVVRIIDTTTGEEVATLPKGREFTWAVHFTPDGNNLQALDQTGLTVWRAIPPEEALKLKATKTK